MSEARFLSRLLLLTLTAGACNSTVELPEDAAELRLLHATPNLGPVDLQVGGVTVVRNLEFAKASPIVLVAGGTARVQVRSGTALLGELTHTLSAEHLNTVVVAGGVPQFSSVVTPDTGQAANNRANVRMVNVVGSQTAPPTLLDVKVKAPNANPDSVLTFGVDTRVARYGSLMYFDPGAFTFTYLAQGTTAPVLTEVSFSVAAGQVKAVVLERDADGSYKAQVVEER